jgi:hypothetical protein
MAEAAKGSQRPPPEEEVVADPKGALHRLAELTRRVMAVPKDEVPRLFTKPKKKRTKRKKH